MSPAQSEARKALDAYRDAIVRRCAATKESRADMAAHRLRVESLEAERAARRDLETAFDLALSAIETDEKCWTDGCKKAKSPGRQRCDDHGADAFL